jgi:hypothetical protein
MLRPGGNFPVDPRVGGRMEITGQELIALLVMFVVPVTLGAWMLRR